VSGFELVKWPINICALELALSYGIGRALRLAFDPTAVPIEFLIISVAIVGFISALTVSRYMPADEALEQLGANVAVGVWINVSLLLSTLVPILGILYLDSLIFWVVSVIVAAAKALHSLEEQRMKTEPKSYFQDVRARHASPSTLFERLIYSAKPDAYALKPFPTAVLLTIQSIGAAIILTAGKAHAVLGISLMVIGNGLYSILSGLARANENRVNPNGSA
jgi:hypothetical protein